MTPRFEEAMDDDFNTAKALGNLFEVVRILNGFLKETVGHGKMEACSILREFRRSLRSIGSILGLFLDPPEQVLKTAGDSEALDREEIEKMIAMRIEARTMKDWAEADRIREELAEKGVILKDRPDGTTDWEMKR
jgi:cysteinyl-tRNA synthetase